MTGDICEKWLLNLDNQMMKEKRTVLLFLDNCTAHPQRVAERLKFVKLIYFPPNMTSKVQPLDQGIIQNVKVYYRKRILRKVIKAIEDNVVTENISIALRMSIAELSKSGQMMSLKKLSANVSKKLVSQRKCKKTCICQWSLAQTISRRYGKF